jgi:hypothetical protein
MSYYTVGCSTLSLMHIINEVKAQILLQNLFSLSSLPVETNTSQVLHIRTHNTTHNPAAFPNF